MGNFLLADPSLSDEGAIYNVTGEATEAPADNLQTMQPKELYEIPSAAAGSKVIDIDLGTSASYDFFALLFTNLSASATWSITSGTNGVVFGTTLLASTTFRAAGQTGYPRTHGFYVHSSTETNRFVRLTLSDTGNTDGVLRLGRLYICKAWRIPADYGLTFGFSDTAEAVETVAGERIPHQRETVPALSFQLSVTGSSAWADVQTNLYELFRKRGSSRDVLAIIDPDDTSYAGRLVRYGTLQPQLALSLPAYQFYQTNVELSGLI